MGYHDQAYTPIGAANVNLGHAAVWSDLSADILGIGSNKGLYNGNIAHMLVGVPQLERQAAGAGFAAYAYQYDQLHRIIQSQDYGLNPLSNGWTALATANSNYTYDPNGNILSLSRVAPVGGLPTLIDKLTYNYNRNANGDLLNNKLNYIADNQGVTHANIGDLGSQNANNYTYDAIGQLTQDAAEGITNVVWNIQAKVERVDFGNGKPTVYYTYDAQGNRLTKKVNNATTYYIRDAKGNILATYEQNIADIVLAEQHLYGSARLGLRKANILVKNAGGLINPDANRRVYTRSVGQKSYEQTNHLGDVVVTLSDKVLRQGTDYQAIVRNAGLSYPFGWEIPERSYTSAGGGYRFGFNGKENDAETGWQDYGFRLHDRRICRFISVDPLTAEYPELTPYQFAGNTPIEAIDLDGAEPLHLSATEYKNHASETFQYHQTYDGQTHEINMMRVDGDWIFSRPENDKEQWYYLNQNREWEKFSNNRNYADGVRETVNNTIKFGAYGAGAGVVLGIGAVVAAETGVAASVAATTKAIFSKLMPRAKNATPKAVQNGPKAAAKEGLSSAKLGKIIGWGEGQSTEAVQQTINVITNLTKSQVQRWAKQGLTKSWVQDQLTKYSSSLMKGGDKLKNTQLVHRKELMEKILELW